MDRYDPEFTDEEERELMESLGEVDASQAQPPDSERLNELRQAARRFVQQEAKMNIRISSSELERIKERAEEQGLKYQTFVKSILHKYLTGQLVERDQNAG